MSDWVGQDELSDSSERGMVKGSCAGPMASRMLRVVDVGVPKCLRLNLGESQAYLAQRMTHHRKPEGTVFHVHVREIASTKTLDVTVALTRAIHTDAKRGCYLAVLVRLDC